MELKLVNRLAMIGVEFVGIGSMLLNPATNPVEVQKQVVMDLDDIMNVEREVERRKRNHELEFYYGNYKIVIKK